MALDTPTRQHEQIPPFIRRIISRIPAYAWIRAAWRYGPAVARTTGINTFRQFYQLARLGIFHRVTPDEYYRYRMYRLVSGENPRYLSLRANIQTREELYSRLSIAREPLTDKRKFYRRCATVGLPVPQTLAEFDQRIIHWWSDAPLEGNDLFAKEGASLCGAGAALWSAAGPAQWRKPDGSIVGREAIIAELCLHSETAMMILQYRLQNHPDLQSLGPVGLCTARIVTIRGTQHTAPSVLLAIFRMPTGRNVADNFALGGLACAIDPGTGVLGPATYKSLALAHLDITEHPDTGAPIAGVTLPHWNDVVALALKAHTLFPAYPSVGWDVAITPQGPMLIEGNYNWDVVLAQQAGRRPLGKTDYESHVRAWWQFATSGTQRLRSGAELQDADAQGE